MNAQKKIQSQRRDFQKPQAGRRRKRERNFDAGRISKAPKTSAEMGLTSTGPGNDVSMLMDYLPDDDGNQCSQTCTQNTHTESIRIDPEKNGDLANDMLDHYDCSPDLKPFTDLSVEKGSHQYSSLDEHLDILDERTWDEIRGPNDLGYDDAICSSYIQPGTQDRSVGCGNFDDSVPNGMARNDEYDNYGLEKGDDGVKKVHQQPFSNDEYLNDDNRFGHEYTNGINQILNKESAQRNGISNLGNSLDNHLSPSEPVFCDMGAVSIEVTPIISRRWHFF
mmetsp:Transcript_21420/g.51784  ORF Transcript_21420/g.51784 Transcript_21420/m.51784 type:complete len:279 (+) Transcript_21420:2-838(+)